MHPRTEATNPTASSSAGSLEAARAAASSDALLRRVQELEQTLAAERTQNAVRARQVEGGVRVLRDSMQQLQSDVRRARDDNVRLADQLEQSRRMVAAMSMPSQNAADVARLAELEHAAQSAQAELAAAKDQLATATREAEALRARQIELESYVATRDAELTRAADRIAELEAQIAGAPRANVAEALPVAAPASDEDMLTDEPPSGTRGHEVPTITESALSLDTTAALSAASARNDAGHRAPEPATDERYPQIPGLRIERFVEDGPAGVVFEAREVASRRPVVVRILPGVLKLLDGKRLDSVLLAKHPNLVSVLAFAVCRQGPYLVMEREEGETATQWIARIGPLPERIALSVALEAARGMRQAAFHGALHGDLGPESVLIEVSGRVRIRGVGLRAVYAQQGDVAQAPSFAAPERLRGSHPPDVRTDLYALGAVMYFLLTGKPPYDGERDAILRQQAANAVPDVREVRGDVSDHTAKLVRKLLSSDPDLRPQTWDQLLVELERRVPGRVSTALRGNLATRTRRFLTAHPWVLGAAVASMLLLAGIYRLVLAPDPSVGERFWEARAAAEKLVQQGDFDGARAIYRRFLAGTGDAAVERQAAARYDELGTR